MRLESPEWCAFKSTIKDITFCHVTTLIRIYPERKSTDRMSIVDGFCGDGLEKVRLKAHPTKLQDFSPTLGT